MDFACKLGYECPNPVKAVFCEDFDKGFTLIWDKFNLAPYCIGRVLHYYRPQACVFAAQFDNKLTIRVPIPFLNGESLNHACRFPKPSVNIESAHIIARYQLSHFAYLTDKNQAARLSQSDYKFLWRN